MRIKELLVIEKQGDRYRQWQDLLSFYLKMNWGELMLNREKSVSETEKMNIDKAYKLFSKGWPTAYITGRCFFYKSDFLIDRSVFIPRPETEILVEKSVNWISSCRDSKNVSVMDIGSGSGCLGLSIAGECPGAEVRLLEADSKALELSKKNARQLSLENVEFYCVRIGEQVFNPPQWRENFDLIVANPPYIAPGDGKLSPLVHDFEPHQALYAGENGLYWIKRWLKWSYDFLKKSGLLIFEFGKGQEQFIAPWIEKSSYKIKHWVYDYSGIKRFVQLTR